MCYFCKKYNIAGTINFTKSPMLANSLRYKSFLESAILSVTGLFILSAPYNWLFSSYLIAGIGVLSLAYGLSGGSAPVVRNIRWRRFAWCFAPLVCLYLLALIGMLYTPDPKAGAVLEKNLSFIVFPAIFLLLGPEFFTLKRLKTLGIVFYISCLCIIILFLIYLVLALHHPDLKPAYEAHAWFDLLNIFSQNPAAYMTETHPRFWVHHTFQVWYMLVAMSMIVYTWVVYQDWYKSWYKKVLNIILLLIFIFFGIFLSLSKMGYLTFALWCIPTLAFLIYKRFSIIASICIIGLLIGGGWLVFHHAPEKKQVVSNTYRLIATNIFGKETDEKTYHDGSVIPRLALWREAAGLIKEKPLFGWGTGAEKCVMHPDQYGFPNLQDDPHPHNQWLLYGIRFGLTGILALGWLFFVGFKLAYRTRNGLLAIFMFLTFCFSLTDRNLDFKIGIIFFGLLYGLFAAFSQYTQTNAKGTSAKPSDVQTGLPAL